MSGRKGVFVGTFMLWLTVSAVLAWAGSVIFAIRAHIWFVEASLANMILWE